MAAGSVTAALDPAAPRPYKQGREFVQRVILTLNDSYVTGGIVVNLAGLGAPGTKAPFAWRIWSVAATTDNYQYVPGSDRTLGKVAAFAGGTQHTSDAAWADATVHAEFRYKA
jgi:hypothetical protein